MPSGGRTRVAAEPIKLTAGPPDLIEENTMNRHFAAVCLRLVLGAAWLAPLTAFDVQAAETSLIVDTQYVADAVGRDAIVWDTRSAAAYAKGHIPGAVNIGDVGVVLRDENSEDYIALERIEALLSDAGIDPAREIIVYGDKASPYVYFGLVTLRYLNATKPRIYHGGIDDWTSAGLAVTSETTRRPAVKLHLTVNPALIVGTEEVVRKLGDPNVQVVDARTPAEYRGEDIRALRGGHIPGAIPIHYMENWVDSDTSSKLEKKVVANKDGMNLKSREQLEQLYSKLDPGKETIVYCQSGIRASETASVLNELGFKNVRVYDSSWIGYGNRLDTPVEDVSYLNVGLMQARMNALIKRLDRLEKEAAEAKNAK
jgi:thiosulfate/3-mercaptopyruvate sulfurtransferase